MYVRTCGECSCFLSPTSRFGQSCREADIGNRLTRLAGLSHLLYICEWKGERERDDSFLTSDDPVPHPSINTDQSNISSTCCFFPPSGNKRNGGQKINRASCFFPSSSPRILLRVYWRFGVKNSAERSPFPPRLFFLSLSLTALRATFVVGQSDVEGVRDRGKENEKKEHQRPIVRLAF